MSQYRFMGFQIGFGEIEITPPLGVELSGYGIYLGRKAVGILDPLYSQAVYFEQGGFRLVIISNDLIGINSKTLEKTRSLLLENLGVKNSIIVATHTHSGPATVFMRGWGEVDPNYVKMLPRKFLEATKQASKSLKNALVGFTRIRVEDVCSNRVVRGGAVDPYLSVLSFANSEHKPLVTLFNYSCHAVCIDMRTKDGKKISADWPGQAKKFINEKTGSHAIFLQGTCGDIDPLVAWKMRGIEAARETGEIIGSATVKALGKIEYEKLSVLKFITKKIFLPFQKLTYETVLEDLVEALEKRGTDPKAVRFYTEWAKSMVYKIKSNYPEGISAEISALRINDTVLVFLPGEVFVEIGLEIKRRSPFENTVVVGYNGPWIGYIPTKEDFRRKGYAAHMVPKISDYPPFVENVGEIVIDNALNMIEELKGE